MAQASTLKRQREWFKLLRARALSSFTCLAFAVIFSIGQLSSTRAQLDERGIALYGGGGIPIKYLVSEFWLVGDQAYFRKLEEPLANIVNQVLNDAVKPEYGLKVLSEYPKVSETDAASVMVMGIQLVLKDGKKLNPSISNFIAAADPVFGRPRIAVEYPYHSYEKPDLFVVPNNKKAFLSEFKSVIQPMIQREVKRIVCNDPNNKKQALCQSKSKRD